MLPTRQGAAPLLVQEPGRRLPQAPGAAAHLAGARPPTAGGACRGGGAPGLLPLGDADNAVHHRHNVVHDLPSGSVWQTFNAAEAYLKSVLCFVFGNFMWTLLEYGFHRFLFHVDYYLPDHPKFLMIHFLLHGIHHYMPMDKYVYEDARLVRST